MNFEKLATFCKFFRATIESINNDASSKTKKITFKDILYCCLYMNGSSCSYSLANINMCMNDIIDVSDTAIKNKRNAIDYIHFKKVSDTLLDFVYQENNNQRIIGVDGTYLPLSIELKKFGFQTSGRNTYCIGLVSSLYDIDKKMLINYNLSKKHDERKALIDQIEYLKPNDILIMDRGYYSKELLFLLNEKEIQVIFRMRSNSLMVKELVNKNQSSMITQVTINDTKIRFRIITYKINDFDYFLGTTILNHRISYFKKLYWKRWCTETNFRESKYLLSLNNILSKDINKVQQDIYSHNILFIINSFFKNNLELSLPINKFINTKNLLHLIVTSILYLILYKKLTPPIKKNIIKISNCLLKTSVTSDPDRSFERIRIKPIGKWYYCVKFNNQ